MAFTFSAIAIMQAISLSNDPICCCKPLDISTHERSYDPHKSRERRHLTPPYLRRFLLGLRCLGEEISIKSILPSLMMYFHVRYTENKME